MVMGFQNYSSLPRHLRGMLGLSPELDPATYSQQSRTQVHVTIQIFAYLSAASLLNMLLPATAVVSAAFHDENETFCFACIQQQGLL